jgi:hypothetical protein
MPSNVSICCHKNCNDFGHAFARKARTTSYIRNVLANGQILLPNCLRALRLRVPCVIDFFESLCVFFGVFQPAHLREIERESEDKSMAEYRVYHKAVEGAGREWLTRFFVAVFLSYRH